MYTIADLCDRGPPRTLPRDLSFDAPRNVIQVQLYLLLCFPPQLSFNLHRAYPSEIIVLASGFSVCALRCIHDVLLLLLITCFSTLRFGLYEPLRDSLHDTPAVNHCRDEVAYVCTHHSLQEVLQCLRNGGSANTHFPPPLLLFLFFNLLTPH